MNDAFFNLIETNREALATQPQKSNANNNLPVPLPENNLPPPPLDEKLLPEPWREWLADTSERLQCPLDFPTIPAMVGAAALIGNRIRIRPKRRDSWIVVPNLWGAIVGPPGIMKTPAVNEGLIGVRMIAESERLNYQQRVRDDDFDRKCREQRKAEIIKQMKKSDADKDKLRKEYDELETEEPKEKRIWTSDVTVEKLGELLNENPNGILMQRDELTGFLRMLERSGHEQDRAFYLETWSGDGSFTFDRIGRGQTYVRNMTVSIIGTIQPSMIQPYLRSSLEGYGDDGLIQRFQALVYPEAPKTYKYIDRIPKGRNAAIESFKGLHEFSPNDVKAQRLTDDAGGHYFLQFDDAAQEFFQFWLTDLEINLRAGAFETSALESHLSKYRSFVPTMALIFHLLDRLTGRNENDFVGLRYVELAAAWSSFFQKHAERLYGIARLSEFDCAREILHRLERKDLKGENGEPLTDFAARDIYRKGWSKLNNTKEVKKGLELLVDYGYLSTYVIQTGGCPGAYYRIHESLR